MMKTCLVATMFAVAACGTTTPPGGGQAWISTTNGTVTSSDSGASVSGAISQGQIFAVHYAGSSSNGNLDLGIVDLVAQYAATGGQFTLSKPAGATNVTLVSSVGIKGTPAPGDFTNTSTNACGGVVLTFQVGNTPSVYTATNPYDCQDSSTSTPVAGSSFDLHLSSVSVLDSAGNVVVPGSGSASWAYYKVSGSLNATLVNAQTPSAPTVSISLTF